MRKKNSKKIDKIDKTLYEYFENEEKVSKSVYEDIDKAIKNDNF